MSYTFIQQAQNSTPGGHQAISQACTFSSAVTAGNCIVWATVYATILTSLTVTDTQGNTPQTVANAHFPNQTAVNFAGGWMPITKGGVDTVTFTFGTSVGYPAVYAAEYAGLVAPYFETGAYSTNTQSAPGAGTITSGNATVTSPAMAFGILTDYTNQEPPLVGAGWTARPAIWTFGASTNCASPADRLVSTSGATALTGTAVSGFGSDEYFTFIMAFSTTSTSVAIPRLMTLGCG